LIDAWYQIESERLTMGFRQRLLFAALAITTLLIATVACGSAGGNRIAFTSERDGNPEVYSAQSDG